MMAQDSSDSTGVVVAEGKADKSTERARERKANAALKLALDDVSWKKIARTLGYPTERAALVAVEQALERSIGAMDREHLRLFYSRKLERLYRAVEKKALDHEAPEQLAAVGKAREIIADQRKLHGTDAPAEIIVTNPTTREIDEWVAKMTAEQIPDLPEADITVDVVEGEWTEATG